MRLCGYCVKWTGNAIAIFIRTRDNLYLKKIQTIYSRFNYAIHNEKKLIYKCIQCNNNINKFKTFANNCVVVKMRWRDTTKTLRHFNHVNYKRCWTIESLTNALFSRNILQGRKIKINILIIKYSEIIKINVKF